MFKIITSTFSQGFPKVLCLATYFTLHVSLNFPIMLVLSIIILHQHCYKILLLLYIHFIDIKGIAWGHGQVIGMCSHAIFYISCIERYHPRLLVAICTYMWQVAMLLGTITIVAGGSYTMHS